MSNEIIFPGSDSRSNGRSSWLSRQARAQRDIMRRGELATANLVSAANVEAAKGELRRRLTEKAMYDVVDVAELAQQLAEGNEFVMAALLPLVKEFRDQTVRDVRSFARELGL